MCRLVQLLYTLFFLRKAALSFAPDYITTGPTLKALDKYGKLFNKEFKIIILNDK